MNNETKEFLVQMFNEQEKKLETLIDAKFAEQDKKFDARFAELKRSVE